MVFAFTWAWRDAAAWNDFSAGNLIGFYGGATYGTKVKITEYQSHNHLRTAAGTDTDACASPHMDSIQYVASATCQINQGGVVNVNTIAENDCVRIHFSDGSTSISTENATFYAYDGTTDATAPTNVTAYALERSDAAWTACGGSASAVSLTNQGANINHYFYVAMSVSPDTVGEKTAFAWKISLDYY